MIPFDGFKNSPEQTSQQREFFTGRSGVMWSIVAQVHTTVATWLPQQSFKAFSHFSHAFLSTIYASYYCSTQTRQIKPGQPGHAHCDDGRGADVCLCI